MSIKITLLCLFLEICQLWCLTSSASRPVDSPAFDRANEDIGTRIIGGEATDIETYPFTVSIQWRHNGRHHCGGTYIAERFVLTAAHCLVRGHYWIAKSPWMFTVVAGSTTLWYSPTWQTSNVDNLVAHHLFSFHSMVHDIGLLRTSSAFYINRYVTYARIPTVVNDDLFNDYSQKCAVVGWGRTSVSTQLSSGVLRHARIPLIDNEQCSRFYSHRLHPGQICAGMKEGGVDACQGDSGGPLVCNGTQVGLVSWGQGCAVANSPGVYCRLDYYFDWINETMSTSSSDSIKLHRRRILQIFFITFVIHLCDFMLLKK
ncbi:trypsin I-P1-like isoform X2 [Diachasmimorpha longicaudata]|uniref:trypsin I-P1-like isoform X2 n=1 Tax=Diachasmimorpha longicaudata TaxID=58733 RepID=UPI0030B8862A